MADLVAITYPDDHRAAEVVVTLRRLQNEYLSVSKEAEAQFQAMLNASHQAPAQT
jgi:hypothetical protein